MRLIVLTVLGVVFLGGVPVHAQRVEPQCTYDTCALRTEAGKLVRGISGEKVVRLGLFGAAVAPHVATSDSAVVYARMYESNHATGTALLFLGEGVALGALGWFDGSWNSGFPSISTARGGIAIGGLVVMLYGATRLNKAERGLSRAIWWYNRDLAIGTTK